MQDRKQIIADCELMRRELTDFTDLDAEIEGQVEEIEVVAELVDALVKENAAAPQSQKVYSVKYENLNKRYETASAELNRLRELRAKREQQDKAMASFIRSLRKQPEVLNTWNDTIWMVMVTTYRSSMCPDELRTSRRSWTRLHTSAASSAERCHGWTQ